MSFNSDPKKVEHTSLPKNELKDQLDGQVQLLIKRCTAFDSGDIEEAKSIAITIRILVYDRKWPSLLRQLNLGVATKLVNSCLVLQGGMPIKKSETYLAASLLGNQIHQWKPNFDDTPVKLCNFDQWWNGIIVKDFEGNDFTRKNLVMVFANQDGGAHVDSKIESKFYNLTRKNSMQQFTLSGFSKLPEKIDGSQLKSITSPAYYAVRQIAHELLKSLSIDYEIDKNQYSGLGISFFSLS